MTSRRITLRPYLFFLSRFSTGVGMGKSLMEEIWLSSVGLFVRVNSCLSFSLSSSSSNFEFVISCVSRIERGSVS